MTYLINETRLAEIRINGVDVTDTITEVTLSDSSGIKQGLIATDGAMTMNYRNGATPIEDYKRNLFGRGTSVDIFVTFPSGNRKRHPRGSLVVLDTLFNPEEESVTINVGCKMALAALTEDIDEILDLVDLYMPSTRRNYAGISAALATMGKIAWYDATGNLRVEKLWSGETQTSSPSGTYVSVFGLTALAASGLNANRSFEVGGKSNGTGVQYPYQDPDNIDLDYEYGACRYGPNGEEEDCIEDPNDPDDPDDSFTEELVTSDSSFFTQYPAMFYERVPVTDDEDEDGEDNLDNVGTPDDEEGTEDGRSSACIDEPLELDNPASAGTGGGKDNGQTSCMSNYETARVPLLVGVTTRSESLTKYEGPGRSRNYVITKTFGPALSANSQYIGDIYQLCRQSWANKCSPNGFCSTDPGTAQVQLTEEITQLTFNEDGSVNTETRDSYSTVISALGPDSWRAGVEDGQIVGFRTVPGAYNLFRSRRQIVQYEYPKNGSKRTTTEYTSQQDWGGRLPSISEMDALNGLVKTTIDRSRNNAVNADQPPSMQSPEPETFSDESEVVFPDHDGLGSKTPGSGKNANFKETIPYPILLKVGSPLTVKSVVENYEDYLSRILKAQSLGIRVAEALREEVVSAWKPNQSWRYADPRYNTIISMRGDAHTWSITPEYCHFTVDGLAVGFSNGTLSVPDNVQGVATPTIQ